MHIYSHSELSGERASKSYIAFPQSIWVDFRKQTNWKGQIEPEKPLLPAQAGEAAAQRESQAGQQSPAR